MIRNFPVSSEPSLLGIGVIGDAVAPYQASSVLSLIDPDCTRPAGWPSWAGQPCRFMQTAGEAAKNYSMVVSATDIDTAYWRGVYQFATLPGGVVMIWNAVDESSLSTVYVDISNTGALRLWYHVAAGFVEVPLATVAVGRTYYVEIAYSVSGQWVAYRVQGHRGNKAWTFITGVTLDRGGMRSLFIRTSTVTTYNIDYYLGGVELRTDRAPSLLPPSEEDSMAVYWVTGQTYHTSAALAAAASTQDNIALSGVNSNSCMATAKFTFATAPTTGEILIELLPVVDGTTTYSTRSWRRISIPANECGTTMVQPIEVVGPSMRIKVTNGTNQAATYEGKYAYAG